MGKLQQALESRLAKAGYPVDRMPLPRPDLASASDSRLIAEVLRVFKALGGVLEHPPTKPGAWDLTVGGFAVEFDEPQHFNRYRSRTLESSLYARLPAFPMPEYRESCETGESACRKKASFGNYWTTPSSERQFGGSGPPGDLEGAGSARWKQRAFYDFLRDISPLHGGPQVVRISCHDLVTVRGSRRPMSQVLSQDDSLDAALATARLFEDRARPFLPGEYTAPIWNGSLRPEHVPGPEAPWLEVARFALSFSGYQFWGGTQDCLAIGLHRNHSTLTDLRTCLFFQQRRIRFDGREPVDSEWDYLRWLVERIREAVRDRAPV